MQERGVVRRSAVNGLRGLAEAMFPENDLGAPDWKETEMVRRTLAYVAELPPAQGRLLILLFVFVELLAPLLLLSWPGFSRIPVERRTLAIRRWRASRFLPLRLLGDAIKASMTMIYMSHAKVSRYIGEYKTCARPTDEVAMRYVPDALERLQVDR